MSKARIGNQITYERITAQRMTANIAIPTVRYFIFFTTLHRLVLALPSATFLRRPLARHRPRQFYPSLRTTWQGRRAICEETDEVPAHLSGWMHTFGSFVVDIRFMFHVPTAVAPSLALEVKPRTAPQNDFSLSWERLGKGATKLPPTQELGKWQTEV